MHILENHVVPFIENLNVSLGRLAEQGGELLHSEMLKFTKRTAGIRNKRQRLLSTIEAHHAHNSQELISLIPKKQKRGPYKKKKNNFC